MKVLPEKTQIILHLHTVLSVLPAYSQEPIISSSNEKKKQTFDETSNAQVDLSRHWIHIITVRLTSIGKTCFALHFILNENVYSDWPYLIRNHLSFLFLCVCSQICTLKLNLRPKIGLTCAISIVKWFFFFLFFFLC